MKGSKGDSSTMPSNALTSVERSVRIPNTLGLHARAAGRFVKVASGFKAAITVDKDGVAVSGLSIMSLLMLAAGVGSELRLQATGPDAEAAMAALAALVENGFDEGAGGTPEGARD
ncbi:MAG: HPr family phosphocarrier protein [Rhodospirillales bacterium]|nr:HPr family phosphocarrier protein [Rhodospirillales bacterium]